MADEEVQEIEIAVSDQPYRIYQLLPADQVGEVDHYVPPHTVDFTTGLSSSLIPVIEFDKGSRIKTTWYGSQEAETHEQSWPVVEVYYNWEFDALGLAECVQKVAYWYLMDGTVDVEYPKVFQHKHLTPRQQVEEAQRRRDNQLSHSCDLVITLLIEGGYTNAQAMGAGLQYWGSLTSEHIQFRAGNRTPLLERIWNDATPAWVPAIKEQLYAELS